MRTRFLLLLALALPLPGFAQELGLRLPEVQGLEGDTVEVVVSASGDFSGKNVWSYRLSFTYFGPRARFLDVSTTGTISAGATVSSSFSEGRVTVAAASSAPLSGTGPLVRVRLVLRQPGHTGLDFDRIGTYLNEGSPALSFTSGSLSVSALPTVNVGPGSSVIAVGETVKLAASGGTGPYAWRSLDSSVATVGADGTVRGIAGGTARIVARDANGREGQATVEVRAFTLTLPNDPSAYPGDSIAVPLTTSDLSGLSVTSGGFVLTYNANVVELIGVEQGGTLLAGMTVTHNATAGRARIAFAGPSAVAGGGTLLRLKLKAKSPGHTNLGLEDVLFGETLRGLARVGAFRTLSFASLSISPGTAALLAGETLSFGVSGGTAPYRWRVSDERIATISETGVLTARLGGRVTVTVEDATGAKQQSGLITIYDARLRVMNAAAQEGTAFPVTLDLGALPEGRRFSAFQLRVRYDARFMTFERVETVGTRAEGWSVASRNEQGAVVLAAAGASPAGGGGTLVTLRFRALYGSAGRGASVSLEDVLLDEGSPSVRVESGSVTFSSGPVLEEVGLEASLEWDVVEGATAYHLQIATEGTFGGMGKAAAIVLDTTVTAAWFTVPAGYLKPATVYEWRVRPVTGSTSGTWSEPRVFRTKAVPAAPTLTAPINAATQIERSTTLRWQALSGVTGYRIQLSTSADFATLVLNAVATGSEHNITDLASLTAYFWRVRGINAEGEGVWSTVFRFTTQQGTAAEPEGAFPDVLMLDRATPNPVRTEAAIRFGTRDAVPVRLDLYDALGRHVRALFDGVAAPGQFHTVELSRAELPSGLYLVRLTAGAHVRTQPVTLLR